MKLPTVFILEAMNQGRRQEPETPSREPGGKSEEEKAARPYSAAVNGDSLSPHRTSEVQTFTPVPHPSHRGVFNFLTADLPPHPPCSGW